MQKRSRSRKILSRLRTAFFIVLGIALLGGSCLWLVWRYNVNAALEAALADGPDGFWVLDPLRSATKADYALLLSDYEDVSNRLIRIAESDDPINRRINAVKVMESLSARSGSLQVREQLLPRLIDLACDGTTPSPLVRQLAITIADWIPATGVSTKDRARLCNRARKASGDVRIAWIGVLDSIGGREEVELLLKFGDTHDEGQLWAVYNSQFRGITWEGMLPHLRRWIRDPVIAETALEFSALWLTNDGREVLLEFMLDPSQADASREQAAQQLSGTVAGIDLLRSVADDPMVADVLIEVIGPGYPESLAAERSMLVDRNGAELWRALIDGLDPHFWFPSSPGSRSADVEAELKEHRQLFAQLSLDGLRILSGRDDLATQDEWTEWLAEESPGLVELRRLLQLVINHPELLRCTTIYRRLIPYELGEIPDDCLPLYHQMLQSSDLSIRYVGCWVLLTFTDSPEAIDGAIDLIGQSEPQNSASVHSGEIRMLQQRFAVNFFWDTAAWRKWARGRQHGGRSR